MRIAMLLLISPGVTPFLPAATQTTLLRMAPARQAVLVMSGRAAPRRRDGNKQMRRAKLVRDLEATPAPRLPDCPADEDPATPLALAAAQAGDDRKAQQITALRVGHLTSATSYFVNMQGSSRAQIDAIVKNVEVELLEQFGLEGSRQGKSSSGWVCLDFDSIVVNVFSPEERAFYGLEKFWSGGQQLDLSEVISPAKADPAEAVDEWAVDADDDDDNDDWSLGSDDWALGSGDDWNLSSATTEDEWTLSEEDTEEWSLGEEGKRDWSIGGQPAAASASFADTYRDMAARDALAAKLSNLNLSSTDEANGEIDYDAEIEAEVEEEDWALGDDKLRVRVTAPASRLSPYGL